MKSLCRSKIGELKFIDSFQFMASSIEKLTEHLYTTDYKPFYQCEDNDDAKEHMESYLEYMRTFEPDTLKNMYEKKKNATTQIQTFKNFRI